MFYYVNRCSRMEDDKDEDETSTRRGDGKIPRCSSVLTRTKGLTNNKLAQHVCVFCGNF